MRTDTTIVFRTLLLACVALGGVAPLYAQRSGRVTYNRPSDYGPSGAIDRVGGTFTGSSASVLSEARATGQAASVRTGWRGGGGALGEAFYAPMTMGIGAQMLRFTPNPDVPVGSSRFATRFDALTIDTGRVTQSALSIASGFNTATSLATPLHGWRVTPPATSFGVQTLLPATERDAYREVMGLKPAETERGEPPPVWVKLSELNAKVRQTAAQRALDLFRAGMYPEASDALVSVRRSDPSDPVASLLAAHAALAQQQFSTAASLLLEAVRRRPTLFAERIDVRRFYGSADEHDRRMRELSRFTVGSDFSEAWMLKAYGAWAIGDSATVREFLGSATKWKKNEDPDAALAMEQFSAALYADYSRHSAP